MKQSTEFYSAGYSPGTVRDLLQEHQVKIAEGEICHYLYSIYDARAGEFAPPAVAYSGFIIARGIAEMVNANRNSPIALYPADFHLFCIGRFDVRSGCITPYTRPQPLGSLKTILEAVAPSDLTKFIASVEALLRPVVPNQPQS